MEASARSPSEMGARAWPRIEGVNNFIVCVCVCVCEKGDLVL